ncbi:MAG TPA: hypothetical protein ENK44_09045 [Caldithrix abyssi]|uniref:Potassium channel domain-containing protein n=1 Tax=Caldithrix abyssi TaxID=187145 RepID=A0A7V4WV43_CALAY|nr:hypothetical protein [Caldithrix abyssi]
MSKSKIFQSLFGRKSVAEFGHFEVLFIALMLALLVKPFFKGFVGVQILTNLFLTIIYITAIFTVIRSRKIFLLTLVVVVPTIVLTWLGYFFPLPEILALNNVVNLVFFTYTIALLLAYIIRQKRVTRNVIMGAMSAYMLMAFLWATAYTLLETISPGSFHLVNNADASGDLLYFSFVTITTLGYGDITPLTYQARALVVTQTILGQMYVAIMIARLVGIQIAQSMEEK